MTLQPIVVVGGPTASGKSLLAVTIARAFNGVIINADSMQIYNCLPILTAHPDKSLLNDIPHKLYGALKPTDHCDAMVWKRKALGHIKKAQQLNKLPILVGGTGFYLHTMLVGLHAIPMVPLEIRVRLNSRVDKNGIRSLYDELVQLDPETAADLKPTDSQRIIRALEVLEHTGKGLAYWKSIRIPSAPPEFKFFTIILMPCREDLYEDINKRFDLMVELGAIEEVRALIKDYPNKELPVFKAVGVSPIVKFLEGNIDKKRMLELGKRDSRRYAKRQMTWFRNQIIPDFTLKKKYMETLGLNIFPKISKFLLTD